MAEEDETVVTFADVLVAVVLLTMLPEDDEVLVDAGAGLELVAEVDEEVATGCCVEDETCPLVVVEVGDAGRRNASPRRRWKSMKLELFSIVKDRLEDSADRISSARG